MVDFRLYRLCFLPALLAVVVAMFSLEGAPDPLQPLRTAETFDGTTAAATARKIVSSQPDRTPGSAGDSAVADLVLDRFKETPAGAVSEQSVDATYDGDAVTLRNVLLTLPGVSPDQTIVIVAARDAVGSPGAASSAAATGILVELASALRTSHQKTLVLASVSGSEAGAAGIRKLVEGLPDPGSVEAVIVISQPGAADPRPPYVIGSSTGEPSVSVQLERTAELAVSDQALHASPRASGFTQLARLAIPSGLGDQAPLIATGLDAIAISSAGERPLDAADDQPEDASEQSIDGFGRATQSTIGAIDAATATPVHGPPSHLELGENLVPGWALAALALALLLPAAAAAVDGCARAARRGDELLGGLAWALARSLPFIGALAALYGLATVGVVPRPPFPFDPSLYELGPRAAITFAVIIAVALASAWLLRSRKITAARAPVPSPVAIGSVAVTACAAVWLANPYLALLLVPIAHVWLLAVGEPSPRRAVVVAAVSAFACLPAIAAFAAVAKALSLGGTAPWTFTLMVADGQLGFVAMAALCFLGGCLAGALALAMRRRAKIPASD